MGKSKQSPGASAKSSSSKARERSAEALRENLLRRKAQQRARAAAGPEVSKPARTKAEEFP